MHIALHYPPSSLEHSEIYGLVAVYTQEICKLKFMICMLKFNNKVQLMIINNLYAQIVDSYDICE
jgi:hypothetical protein